MSDGHLVEKLVRNTQLSYGLNLVHSSRQRTEQDQLNAIYYKQRSMNILIREFVKLIE